MDEESEGAGPWGFVERIWVSETDPDNGLFNVYLGGYGKDRDVALRRAQDVLRIFAQGRKCFIRCEPYVERDIESDVWKYGVRFSASTEAGEWRYPMEMGDEVEMR